MAPFLVRIAPSTGDNRANKPGANPPADELLLRAKRRPDPFNQLLGCWVLDIRYDVLETSDLDLGVGQEVLDYWDRLRGEAFAPAWSNQFKLTDLPTQIVPDMTVIDIIDGGRNFYYRFWGTNHVVMKGFEMSGKMIDQTPNEMIQEIGTRQLQTVIERRRPTVFLYSIDYPRRHKPAEFILRLPLSSDGEAVDCIVSHQDLSSSGAQWETLFEKVWPSLPQGSRA